MNADIFYFYCLRSLELAYIKRAAQTIRRAPVDTLDLTLIHTYNETIKVPNGKKENPCFKNR